MNTFNKSGDDSQLQSQLDIAIETNDKSKKGLARQGLYFSCDDVFRSSCIQYLDALGLITEADIARGLEDESDVVRIEAISVAESYVSEAIEQKLSEACFIEKDEFALSQIIFALGVKGVTNDFKPIKKSWSSSELVQCSFKFFDAMLYPSENSTKSFFQFLKSESHIVRGFVVNYSDCFVQHSDLSMVYDLLSQQYEIEDIEYIRELIEIRKTELSSTTFTQS